MGSEMCIRDRDYTQANALGDQLSLPYFSAIISNDILSNSMINRISLPFVNFKKRRSMMRTYTGDNQPIVPPYGQRRLKRSSQTTNVDDMRSAQHEDEVMRGKTKSNKTASKHEIFLLVNRNLITNF